MKDAVGGSVLFYIILVFLAIYIVFIGVIMNYAATYRASNYVLTRLEQTDGAVKLGSKSDQACQSYDNNCTLFGALKSLNYYNGLSVCYKKNSRGVIFKIETTVDFQMPFFAIDLTLPIRNETKTIYNVSDADLAGYGYPEC